MDSRELNYSQYFTEGDLGEAVIADYTSDNAQHLSIEEIERLLFEVEDVRRQLARAGRLPAGKM